MYVERPLHTGSPDLPPVVSAPGLRMDLSRSLCTKSSVDVTVNAFITQWSLESSRGKTRPQSQGNPTLEVPAPGRCPHCTPSFCVALLRLPSQLPLFSPRGILDTDTHVSGVSILWHSKMFENECNSFNLVTIAGSLLGPPWTVTLGLIPVTRTLECGHV